MIYNEDRKRPIFLLIIFVLSIILFSLRYCYREKPPVEHVNVDSFRRNLLIYVNASGDIDLKFGRKEPVKTVDKLVKLMKSTVRIGSTEYGPYFDPEMPEEYYEPHPGYKGWEIIYYKDECDFKVMPSDKDRLKILDSRRRGMVPVRQSKLVTKPNP